MKACPACNSRYEDGVAFCNKDGTPVVADAAAAAQAAAADAMIGQIIGDRYKLLKKLGEGGMGEVYKAEHIHIEKHVALKLLRTEILSNQEAVTRFRQEARSASSIGHENIIEIDDFGTLPDGRVYLTMEFLDGEPLNDMAAKGPIPVQRALDILIQTGRGLAAAHAKAIVHRDMKPENIYVTHKNGRDVPKILDFGIAKVSGSDSNQNLTRTGTIFGTPFYMAPEQAMGGQMDHRADIYAMGVILFEIFTGQVPFKAESFMGILTQHITAAPPSPSQLAAANGRQFPPELEPVILRALAKNPTDRYQSMNELVQAMVDVYRRYFGSGATGAMAAAPASASSFMPVATGYQPSQTGQTGALSAIGQITPMPGQMGMGGMSGQQITPLPMQPMQMGQPGMSGAQMTPMPMPIQGVPAGTYPPSAGYYVQAAPAKQGKTGLIVAITVIALAGGGGAAWYFLMGPGKKADAAQASTTDPGGSAKPGGGDTGTGGTQKGPDNKGPVVTPGGPTAGGDKPPVVEVKPTEVLVSSVPTHAEVWVDGGKKGETPMNLSVVRGKPLNVTLKLKGYDDVIFDIDGSETRVEYPLKHVVVAGGHGPTTPGKGDGKKKDGTGVVNEIKGWDTSVGTPPDPGKKVPDPKKDPGKKKNGDDSDQLE